MQSRGLGFQGLGLLGLGQGGQVHAHQVQRGLQARGMLAPSALGLGRVLHAQRIVVLDESAQGVLEHGGVQGRAHLQQQGLVEGVRQRRGLEEGMLHGGQRHRPPHQPLLSQVGRVLPGHRGQRFHRLVLEELARRQPQPGLARPRHHLQADNRVASQLEEVVADADPGAAQHLGPDVHQRLLGGIARGLIGRGHLGLLAVGSGQRLAVHLAVGRQWQRIEAHEGTRNHVLRQPLLEVRAQLGHGGLADDVGHQALEAMVLSRDDDGLVNGRVLQQRRLYLRQLDAEATDLHLRIGAPEELQHAVGAAAHQVSGTVHASAGLGAEGVSQETLGGELGLAKVAAREPVTGDEELAGHAHRERPQEGVEDVQTGVADGGANGDGGAHLGGIRHAEAGGEERGLGGAVAGRHRNAQLLQHAAHVGRGDDVAAGEQLLHRAQALEVCVHHLGEEARGEVEGGDAVAFQDELKLAHVIGGVGREEDEPATVEQRSPDLERGGIEGDGGDEQEGVLGSQLHEVDAAQQQAHDGAVLDADALGPAGGAGGEVDVGQVARGGGGGGRGGGLPLQGVGDLVEQDERQAFGGQARGEGTRGEEDLRLCVLEHVGEALARVVHVEGHVGATGLEDGEQGDDELDGALQAEGDARVGADAMALEEPGELVGALVELAVGESLVRGLQGDGVGAQGDLLGEDVVDAGVARVVVGRVVPALQHLVPLRVQEQRQRGRELPRVGDHAFNQPPQVPRHAGHRRGLEEVGAVVERPAEAVLRVLQRQRQVEARGVAVHRHRLQGEARQGQLGNGRVLQDEHHLEQRRAAEAALRLQRIHQLLEGHVLVGVGAQRRLTHAGEQLSDGELPVQLRAQHQGVDEEADEPLRFAPRAAGDGRADAEVVLARVTRQQHLPRAEERHEGSDALTLRQGLERLGQLPGERHGLLGTTEGLHHGTRPVGGQLQRLRRPGELLAPVCELPLQHFSLEPAALPGRVIGVLDGQLGQRRFMAGDEALV